MARLVHKALAFAFHQSPLPPLARVLRHSSATAYSHAAPSAADVAQNRLAAASPDGTKEKARSSSQPARKAAAVVAAIGT